jgi:hypothetical protein
MCFTVMAGRHASSSFRMLRQIMPEGNTLGWYSGGTKEHFGGWVRSMEGSSDKFIVVFSGGDAYLRRVVVREFQLQFVLSTFPIRAYNERSG